MKQGVFAGIIISVGAVVLLVLTKRDPFFGLNAGFFAMCTNFLVTVVVSLLKPRALNPFAPEPHPHLGGTR